MPRLTPKNYLKAHDQLRRLWLHNNRVFAELSPAEQWQLHDFFQPAKDLSDLKLLVHRERISKERPSLPHRAGRAFAKLQERAALLSLQQVRRAKAPVVAGSGPRRQSERKLTIKTVAQPEVDVEKLARAFINMYRTSLGMEGLLPLPRSLRDAHEHRDEERPAA